VRRDAGGAASLVKAMSHADFGLEGTRLVGAR
jgi:hypothetical protein